MNIPNVMDRGNYGIKGAWNAHPQIFSQNSVIYRVSFT